MQQHIAHAMRASPEFDFFYRLKNSRVQRAPLVPLWMFLMKRNSLCAIHLDEPAHVCGPQITRGTSSRVAHTQYYISTYLQYIVDIPVVHD